MGLGFAIGQADRDIYGVWIWSGGDGDDGGVGEALVEVGPVSFCEEGVGFSPC